MYNRYQGNSGRVQRVQDAAPAAPLRPVRPGGTPVMQTQPPVKRPPPGRGGGLGDILPFDLGGWSDKLRELLPRLLPEKLEGDDLLILLMLYLMYRESGDKELLIIMGAMFLL